MSALLVIIHIIICVALIMIVLLQTGKGADMGAAFGGGSSQTLFGSSGASTFLSKATTVVAIAFMLTSFGLALVSSKRIEGSLVLEQTPPITSPAETAIPDDAENNNSGALPSPDGTPPDTDTQQ